MNARCAARRFCACRNCRDFAFDTEGGDRRGTPLTIRDERKRALAGHTPTHRKEIQA